MINKKHIFSLLTLQILLFAFPFSVNSQQTTLKATKVNKVNFEGNDYFSSSQLENMIVLKPGAAFTNEQLDQDIKNIISNYQKEGYLDCSIQNMKIEYNFDSSSVILDIGIKENSQTLIGEIDIEGNKFYTTKFLSDIMYTKPGKVLDEGTLNQDITQILNNYEKNGFAFASINVKDIIPYQENGKEKLKIIISIEENDIVKIDKIVIEGNTTTNDNVILREIRLNKNTITRDDILEHQKTIGEPWLFQHC